MRKVLVALLVLLPVVNLGGCDCGEEGYVSDCLREVAGRPDVAELQFFNQMTDVAAGDPEDVALDLFASMESGALFESRGYTTTSAGGTVQLELDDSSQQVSFDLRASATDITLVSGISAGLSRESRYAAVAMGAVGQPASHRLVIYPRQDRDPADDRVSIRLVNTLSQSVQPLIVVTRAGSRVSELAYGEDSGYVLLRPDDGEIELDLRDGAGNTVSSVSCSVSAEQAYLGVLGYAAFDQVDDDSIRLFCHQR